MQPDLISIVELMTHIFSIDVSNSCCRLVGYLFILKMWVGRSSLIVTTAELLNYNRNDKAIFQYCIKRPLADEIKIFVAYRVLITYMSSCHLASHWMATPIYN